MNVFLKLIRTKKIIELTVGIGDMTAETRKAKYNAARCLMAYHCKINKMSHRLTSAYVGRCPGTIPNMYKAHESFLKSSQEYRSWAEKVEERVKLIK